MHVLDVDVPVLKQFVGVDTIFGCLCIFACLCSVWALMQCLGGNALLPPVHYFEQVGALLDLILYENIDNDFISRANG